MCWICGSVDFDSCFMLTMLAFYFAIKSSISMIHALLGRWCQDSFATANLASAFAGTRALAKPAGEAMSSKELQIADQMHKAGKAKKDIVERLQAARARVDEEGPSVTAVYRHLRGVTYKRDACETRGRPSTLPPRLVITAMQQRLQLIRAAKKDPRGPHMVTCSDIHVATKKVLRERGVLTGGVRMPSEDWLARQIRQNNDCRAQIDTVQSSSIWSELARYGSLGFGSDRRDRF